MSGKRFNVLKSFPIITRIYCERFVQNEWRDTTKNCYLDQSKFKTEHPKNPSSPPWCRTIQCMNFVPTSYRSFSSRQLANSFRLERLWWSAIHLPSNFLVLDQYSFLRLNRKRSHMHEALIARHSQSRNYTRCNNPYHKGPRIGNW